jgi:tripartite-type tricarboxylate transporter receptor subunit TctC
LLTSYASVRPFVENDTVRIVAGGSRGRIPVLQEILSIPESGYPVLAVETSIAIFGRADTPSMLRRKIADDVKAVLADPAVNSRINATGQNVDAQGPDELAHVLKHQLLYVDSIARILGLTKAQSQAPLR